MHYPAQQPYPYAPPPPYMAPPAPPYGGMPGQPYAAPYLAYPAAYPAPPPFAPDPIEARLRAYAQMGTDTAVGAVSGADPRMLKVLDAAVGAMQNSVKSSEQKTAAAIDALATLMEKHRTADAYARQGHAAPQDAAREAARVAALQGAEAARMAEKNKEAEVSQVLAQLVERLGGLEQSVAAANANRSDEALMQARRLEDRVGEALGAIEPEAHIGEHEPQVAPVRPPHRTVRPRITVPRASVAVAEIAARQRMLDAGVDTEAPSTHESAALDAIRKSISALADQVRDTARLRERRAESDLHHELKELQRSVQELAPRQIVASVNESIRALAIKIEQSRREGLRENQLAPVEALLNDMRASLADMREPRGLGAINDTLGLLARRVEAIGERSADSTQLGDIQRQMQELRGIVAEARQQQPVDGIQSQIKALADKLDAASERPRDTRVMSLLADAVEDVRKTMRKLDPEVVFARLERRLEGLEGLEARIEALGERLSAERTAAEQIATERFAAERLAAERIAAERVSGERNTGESVLTVSPVDLGGLTDRIERMTRAISERPGQPDLSPIMRRIDAMQESLETRPSGDTRSLEDVLRRLTDRIEDARQPDASTLALDELQAQMSQLADRLDRTTPNHPALGGLERTLSDLCQKVAAFQDTAAVAAVDAAKLAAADAAKLAVAHQPAGGGGMDSLAAEGMMLIKRDLTEMKSAQAEADSRSRDLLAQVNGSLEKIVNRLSTLETEATRPRAASAPVAQRPVPQVQAPIPAHPVAQPPVARSAPEVAAPRAPAARAPEAAPAVRAPAPSRRPDAPLSSLDSDLDMPLEPGSVRAAGAGLVADSNDPRSNFIAAARRAAQAAAAQTAAAEADETSNVETAAGGGRFSGMKSAIGARRKPILLGLAAVIALVGGLKVFNDVMGPDQPAGTEALPEPAQPREKVAEAPVEDEVEQPAAKSAAPAPAVKAPATEQMAVANQAPVVPPVAAPPVATSPAVPAISLPTAQEQASNPAAGADVAALLKATNGALPDKLKQAAVNGNLSAAYEIGARLAEGRGGVARDLKTAARWLEFAAGQGFAPAQYRLGSFNREGLGVAKDSKVAFGWFEKAARQGNILAMHNLAVLQAEGVNGAPDYANAAQWFRNAAEYGVKDSQFNIAILYVKGLGVAQDMAEGYKWFAAAARQGDQDAVKRRDEVLSRLPADKAQAAKQLAEDIRAKKPDPRANEIATPEGGWEEKSPLPSMARRPKSV